MVRLVKAGGLRAAAVVAFSVAAVAVSAGPASALDQGNNDAACSSTEICFSEYSTNWGQSHKDFWNSANHHLNNAHEPYTFNAGTGATRNQMMDRASGIFNRDDACSIRLWDVNAQGNWVLMQTYDRFASTWVSLGSYGNRNNGHSRCTELAPITK
jgi:hypothetical protein